jgi:hypothetical protein
MNKGTLPPKISKQDICGLLKVSRIRCLRNELFTDEFILIELQLDIVTFNRRQQFSIQESVIIKKYLLQKVPGLFREQQNT